MGTIVPRKRKDGTTGYRAQIIRKEGGEVVWQEAKTFDRRPAATAWLARREAELDRGGGKAEDPPLRDVIDRYVAEMKRKVGRTKTQVLRTIKNYDIADMRCSKIVSSDLVAFAQALPSGPATVANYMSHLSAVFAIARPAWGYPLNEQAIKDAFKVTKRLGVTGKSKSRDRRPTIEELDLLLDHYSRAAKWPNSPNMVKVIPFAIFSTRRQEEITLLLRDDYEPATADRPARVLVRNMKHPGGKDGNDTWCELPPEAAAIIESMPKNKPQIFPYTADAISASFTRACQLLGIKDLRFHDLRHEGASWLFEKGGRDIPQVAKVTGHRTWASLQRYSHIRQSGDKYANWKWRTP